MSYYVKNDKNLFKISFIKTQSGQKIILFSHQKKIFSPKFCSVLAAQSVLRLGLVSYKTVAASHLLLVDTKYLWKKSESILWLYKNTRLDSKLNIINKLVS